MQVWQDLESITKPFEKATVAIGVFDGLHLGHQELVRQAVADARSHGRQSVVFTFDRHPAELIAPERAPGYLTTPPQRSEILAGLGIDHLAIARFDDRFRSLSPESFLRFVAKGVLGAQAVFVGNDFRFGCNQSGDVGYLREAQDRLGFQLFVLVPVVVGGERASSSRVRELLRVGDIPGAEAILGHPFVLSGVVVAGEKLGRKLGWPTANLQLELPLVIPADGIYAGWVYVHGQRYKGACSIGIRPTVGGKERSIEAYLIGYSGDLYGEPIDLQPVKRLRDEIKFDSLEALTEQIARDVADVDALL